MSNSSNKLLAFDNQKNTLRVTKNHAPWKEVLRFAQDDSVGAQDDSVGAQDDSVGAQDDGVGAQDDGVGA